MQILPAKRLDLFPVYLFDQLDQDKAKVEATGADVIDLSVGDPDRETPAHIVQALCEAAHNPVHHHYPSYRGLPEFRQAIASWYQDTFRVTLDPDAEVLSLIGSKGGIGHVPSALADPGDIVLIPDPCYPAYKPGIVLADAQFETMPLLESNGYLPDLDAIPASVRKRAKLMILNYPQNPTAAVATAEFFSHVVRFAIENEIIIVHDAAYSQAYFDGERVFSFLEVPGAKDVGIEINSMSKTFNMSGWRIAFAVGNRKVLAALGKVKSNVDMGVFEPIQMAGVAALRGSQDCVQHMRALYQGRRDVLVEGLNGLGWNVQKPKATFFVWLPVPEKGKLSGEFASEVLQTAHVLITPGKGFGDCGEGYVRIALTVEEERLREVIDRLEKTGFRY